MNTPQYYNAKIIMSIGNGQQNKKATMISQSRSRQCEGVDAERGINASPLAISIITND